MRAAFRVDASPVIGIGHVRRSLSLAHALRAHGAEVRFVTRDLGLDTPALIAAANFDLVRLPPPTGFFAPDPAVPHSTWAGVAALDDARETAGRLTGWMPDWVVVDHYAFDARWHDAAREALGCRIAVIDDLADRHFACDLMIDHNHARDHRAKYGGGLPAGAALLGGPRYALLGAGFAEAPRYLLHGEVRSIGVFMGGVDQPNVSNLVLEAIATSGFDGPVEIVATSANPNLPALRDAAARRTNTEVVTDLADLAGFFARHDLQVGAGGGATWERCCIGVPTLLLAAAENHLAVVPGLAAEGIVVTAEPLGTLDPARIAVALRSIIDHPHRRRLLAERSRALVDGLGARRAALRMLADTLAVRPAGFDDARIMHCWRNHPATRRVSRDTGEIGWEDHVAWLGRTLANPARSLMIGTVGGAPVGVIRFDRLEGGRAEVSLYLDPALHGLTLGGALLRAGEASAPGLDILAEVVEGNIGSARLFESAGYRRLDSTHWIKAATGGTQANSGW